MARAIIEKWDLDFAVIGRITDTGRIVVTHKGVVEADIPLAPLSDAAPLYRRPYAEPPKPEPLGEVASPVSLDAALLKLIASPDLCSRRWIFDQYDSTVGGQTVKRPAAGRCRRRPAGGHQPRPGHHHGLHAALLRGRPAGRRRASRGRGLAQHHRHRRDAARRHRQHELRQSRKTGHHGPVRRRHPRHGRRLHGAGFPRRLRQRLAL